MVTLQALRDVTYDILREEEDVSAYPLTFVDTLLNSAQQRICNGLVVNPMNGMEMRKGQLPFLNTSKFFSNIAPMTTTADIAVGATTIPVSDCTDYPTAGSVYMNGNLIAYTGKTSTTTLTGVTGVLFAFTSGTQISPAFTMPTDFASVINVTYNNRFKLEPKLYDDIFEDLNGYKGTEYSRNNAVSLYQSPYHMEPFYTIVNRSNLLIFNINNTGDQIHMRYEKNPTTMTTSVDCAVDNDVYAKSVIPYFAVGELLYNRGEERRGADLLNFAMGQLKSMYTYYNNSSFEKIS